MNVNFSMLNYVAITAAFYLLAFNLYLYRDSRIIYLTTAEREAIVKKNKRKQFIVSLIIGSIFGGIFGFITAHYPQLTWVYMSVVFGCTALIGLVKGAWKR